MDSKKCSHCNQVKDSNEFYVRRASKDGLEARCKVCSRDSNKKWREQNPDKARDSYRNWYNNGNGRSLNDLWRKRNADRIAGYKRKSNYNLSLEDYEEMLLEQSNLCAICERSSNELDRNFCVDHDHQTGKVRGLLCNRCNRALGMFEDDERLLEAALGYLRSINCVGV